jgi:hypothetical protein
MDLAAYHRVEMFYISCAIYNFNTIGENIIKICVESHRLYSFSSHVEAVPPPSPNFNVVANLLAWVTQPIRLRADGEFLLAALGLISRTAM